MKQRMMAIASNSIETENAILIRDINDYNYITYDNETRDPEKMYSVFLPYTKYTLKAETIEPIKTQLNYVSHSFTQSPWEAASFNTKTVPTQTKQNIKYILHELVYTTILLALRLEDYTRMKQLSPEGRLYIQPNLITHPTSPFGQGIYFYDIDNPLTRKYALSKLAKMEPGAYKTYIGYHTQDHKDKLYICSQDCKYNGLIFTPNSIYLDEVMDIEIKKLLRITNDTTEQDVEYKLLLKG